MDGTAVLVAVCLVASGGFLAGRYMPLSDVRKDCANKGELVIQNTIIKCKPIGAIVDGKRIEFVEK